MKRISVPKPCHENWDAMTPTEKGRFCEACSFEVVDFTEKEEHEIAETLTQANGRVCGRFKSFQVESPPLGRSEKRKMNFWFGLQSLAITVLGFIGLLSKTHAQGKPIIVGEVEPEPLPWAEPSILRGQAIIMGDTISEPIKLPEIPEVAATNDSVVKVEEQPIHIICEIEPAYITMGVPMIEIEPEIPTELVQLNAVPPVDSLQQPKLPLEVLLNKVKTEDEGQNGTTNGQMGAFNQSPKPTQPAENMITNNRHAVTDPQQKIQEPLTLSAFPNPARDYFTIQTSLFGRYTISLFDNGGHLVWREQFTGRVKKFDLNEAPGIYHVVISCLDLHQNEVRRLVIQ